MKHQYSCIIPNLLLYLILMNTNNLRIKFLPFLLTAAIVAADQITKFLIVRHIQLWGVGAFFGGDIHDAILRIVHVANMGVAFSVGSTLSETARRFLFAIMPLVVIALVIAVYFRNDTFTRLQRWCIAGICGGGLGNLIDRFFRSEGVVDFIDFKFFGIFGLERWPTFNVADASVVVCGILLVISFAQTVADEKKSTEATGSENISSSSAAATSSGEK